MAKALLVLGLLAFLFLFPFGTKREKTDTAVNPLSEQRFCLRDSDIDKTTTYTCKSGPNSDQVYYRVMQNVVVSKKTILQGQWDSTISIPQSCINAGMGHRDIPGAIPDRAIRESKRCTDASIYEAWCGDYCDRVIEATLRNGGFVPNVPFCGDDPTDEATNQYLGCFNKSFIFKLKDGETFTQDAPNTFDLYINDTKITECLDVASRYEEIAKAKNIGMSPETQASLQCFRDLQQSIRCP